MQWKNSKANGTSTHVVTQTVEDKTQFDWLKIEEFKCMRQKLGDKLNVCGKVMSQLEKVRHQTRLNSMYHQILLNYCIKLSATTVTMATTTTTEKITKCRSWLRIFSNWLRPYPTLEIAIFTQFTQEMMSFNLLQSK